MRDPRAPGVERWRAPAKINLWLEILGRRDDGLHAVETALQTIDLADVVTLAPPAEGAPLLSCAVDGPFAEGVPAGEANLALRAARLLADRTGHALRLALRVTKAIPTGAGLGGGSSDAAAVLVALGRRFAVPDPAVSLRGLAADLGADVPFLLAGGTAIGTGVGADLAPAAPPAERWGTIVWPGVLVSTAEAYAAYAAGRGGFAAEPPRPGGAGAVARWAERRNDLEPVVAARVPAVARALALLAEGPARAARMTGSGSACFALYGSRAGRDGDLARIAREATALPGALVAPFALAEGGAAPLDEGAGGDPWDGWGARIRT